MEEKFVSLDHKQGHITLCQRFPTLARLTYGAAYLPGAVLCTVGCLGASLASAH